MIKQRNAGIDLARAIALFGMVIVNFKLAMNATDGSAWLFGEFNPQILNKYKNFK